MQAPLVPTRAKAAENHHSQHWCVNQVKALPVKVGPASMIANPQGVFQKKISRAKGALTEYTSTLFGLIPKGVDAFFEHADILIESRGKKQA